ncbi:MAG TPA: 3,4-dihydroxy-2-butanone-4-phosphate synthase [Sphingomonadales bacterium]
MPGPGLSSIEEIINEARNGRMFILVDDEDRENEGDLVIPAQMATPEAINFMAKYGRGLICLSLTAERCAELGLRLMSEKNQSRHHTAFTVSIEAREGISTGISAHDRAHTIGVAIDPTKGAQDIVSPGHVFPLVAREGGVLVRAGHTEAAVDIARLAGLIPAGVICEVMNDDGTMARLPDLMKFAERHNLKIATIADLIAYRLKHDNLVHCAAEMDFHSRHGGAFRLKAYATSVDYAEHLVLVKGNVSTDEPVMVRVHTLNVMEDILAEDGPRTGQLAAAMDMIGEAGRGVVVLIRDSSDTALTDLIHYRRGEKPPQRPELRNYGIGAQILLDLGVSRLILLSNTEKHLIGIEGYGLEIVERRPIPLSSAKAAARAGNTL